MIHNLKPYSSYKDSGVTWLGEVPAHWENRTFRNLASAMKGRQPESLKGLDEKTENGLPYISMEYLRSHKLEVKVFAELQKDLVIAQESDIILLWDGSNAGEFFIAKKGVVSSTSALIRPNLVNFKYFFYACKLAEPTIRAFTVGMGIPHVDASVLKNIRYYLPPEGEQSAIVRYLDYMDWRISRYIHTKQKLIKLLEEQKQAIIHRAVTRGLDADVRLKDSGVEWLGEVPEHWEVRRNGRLFYQRNQTGYPDLPILEVSLKTGIRIRDFDNSIRKQVMGDREKYKRAVKGDIAYNMMRMWQGAVGVVPVDGLVSPAYVVASPSDGVNSEYYNYLFRTAMYMKEVDCCSRGIVKDRNRLYWEDFKQIQSPYPPIEEQNRIVDTIQNQILSVNLTIDSTNQEIALLREYLTRLISDVVTGKLDVRGAAENIAEEIGDIEIIEEGAEESGEGVGDGVEEDIEEIIGDE
jgi:type I restriction enzyme S subunit